jgi:hypothetical protein
MSIYFKNTNKPRNGFNNYLWSWLNSSLKNFAEELSPYIPGGGGIEGTNYIYVMADGTDTENAAELQAAYTTAATMSPSATNRITIVCGPGKYNFGSSAFVMNTQYIDLVSLEGNRSVIFNSSNAAGTISITANDVFVKGVDVGTKSFTIGSNLNLLKVENCKGGDYSFGGQQSGSYGIVLTVSGTFIDCEGGDFCFGATGYQLGGTVTASGTFINCKGGELSFGNEGFGTGNTGFASGIFKNCVVVGYNGFAGYVGVASGTFENCVASYQGFATGSGSIASGVFTNCVGGFQSFGANGHASGVFTNCVGGFESFGGGQYVATLTGKLYYCRLTSGAFQTVSGGGVTRLCLNGSNVENNQG